MLCGAWGSERARSPYWKQVEESALSKIYDVESVTEEGNILKDSVIRLFHFRLQTIFI